jgi:hypothetical protein
VARGYVILDLTTDEEERGDDFMQSAPLAALTPIRTELFRGDLRPAYLAWLLAVQVGDVGDDEIEPPVPAGLADLSAVQKTLVEFLRVDTDLLDVGAEASSDRSSDAKELRRWVARLSPRTKDQWLRRAIDEPELGLGSELLRVFQKKTKVGGGAVRRTVRELRAAAEVRRKARERAEAGRAEKSRRAVLKR